MADSTFRTAEAVAAAKPVSVKVVGKDPDRVIKETPEAPIALHQELNGKPYSATFFEIGQYRDMPDSLKGDLEMIDKAYKTRVERGIYRMVKIP